MTFQALKSKVESLLRQAEFGAALSLIESFTNQPGFQGSSLRENALLLSARYASLKDLQIKGTLKHEEYSKELARLADSIVSMLRETAPPPPVFSFKTPLIIGVLAAFLGIGLWWMFKPEQIEPKAETAPSNLESAADKVPEQQKVHDAPTTAIKEEKPSHTESGKTPAVNQVSEKKESAPVPKKEVPAPILIHISILADACWRDAEIKLDGVESGTMDGILGDLTLPIKSTPSRIQLQKDGKTSEIKSKILKDQDHLNFKCN